MKYQNIAKHGIKVSLDELIRLRYQVLKTKLAGRKRVMTTMAGTYLSGFRGRGMDFMETRHYQPGDDIRAMDWRVTARTGIPHTKLFREERERPIFLLVDYGPQMFFGTKVAFKSVVAAQAAALLAWAAAAHGDRVGGLIFSPVKHKELRPAGGQRGVLRLLKALVDDIPSEGKGDHKIGNFSSALAQLRRLVHPGSLVCLVSDFQGLDTDGEMHIKQLAQHNDILGVFIYDALEMALPSLPGDYSISDGEQILSINSADPSLRQIYQTNFKQHCSRLETLFNQEGRRLLSLATDDNVVEVMRSKLSRMGSR